MEDFFDAVDRVLRREADRIPSPLRVELMPSSRLPLPTPEGRKRVPGWGRFVSQNSREKTLLFPSGKESMNTLGTDDPPKLSRVARPPQSHAGATPDSDRAQKPLLAEPPAMNSMLNPGDRVEGLGNFGVPTGQFGTVERANEEDAIVKWDNDGRMRLRQPWLKKI
jgi:hypothetical protein